MPSKVGRKEHQLVVRNEVKNTPLQTNLLEDITNSNNNNSNSSNN